MDFAIAVKQATMSSRRYWDGLVCPAADGGLSPALNATYASPMIAKGLFTGGLGVLQGIYAKYYGMSLLTLAAIMLFVRIFDAVTDPLAGYWSDNIRRRTGSRKSMIMVGGVLLATFGYLLFVPLFVSASYVAIVLTLFYLGMTIFSAPYYAWGSDLAPTAASKTKIFAAKGVAGNLSWMIYYAVPLLPLFATREVTPTTLKVTAIAAGFAMIVFLALCLRYVPDALARPSRKCGADRLSWQALCQLGRSVVKNPPMLLLFAAMMVFALGLGSWMAMNFLYVDAYLGFGEVYAETYLIVLFIGVIATQAWKRFALRFGKKPGLIGGLGLLALGHLYCTVLTPETASYGHIVAFKLLHTVGIASLIVLLPALMSEVVDYTELKFGTESAGGYFGIYVFVEKFMVAIGIASALSLAGTFGFDATMTKQTTLGVLGMKAAIGWAPAIATSICIALVMINPITEQRHAVIRKRLDALAHRRLREETIMGASRDT